jgi:hypothetical protein
VAFGAAILTGFLPRLSGADVSQDGASDLGVVLCTYDAKAFGAVLWVYFCNCFPQGSLCKILTEKGSKLKTLLLW